eukprot:4238658-Alexandrium_andersonii.AAC.1
MLHQPGHDRPTRAPPWIRPWSANTTARTNPLSCWAAFSTDPFDRSSYAGGPSSLTCGPTEPLASANASAAPWRKSARAGPSS